MRRVKEQGGIAEIASAIGVLPLAYFRRILGLTDRLMSPIGPLARWDKAATSYERSRDLQRFSFVEHSRHSDIYIFGEDATADNSRDIGNRRCSARRLRDRACRNCHQNRMAPRSVGSLHHHTEHRRPRRALAALDE